MKQNLKLALKNLTRQKRRSAVLALAIAFGFFVVTIIDGLVTGMVGNLEESITQISGGTVMIAGYEKTPPKSEDERSTLINIVRDKEYINNIVEKCNVDYPCPGIYLLHCKDRRLDVPADELQRTDHPECIRLHPGNRYAGMYAHRW